MALGTPARAIHPGSPRRDCEPGLDGASRKAPRWPDANPAARRPGANPGQPASGPGSQPQAQGPARLRGWRRKPPCQTGQTGLRNRFQGRSQKWDSHVIFFSFPGSRGTPVMRLLQISRRSLLHTGASHGSCGSSPTKIMKLANLKPKSRPGLTTLTRVVILIALYFLGGLFGKQASFLSGSIALVWPPAGIALAAILLFGYRFWPGVALGAILFSFMNGLPLGFFTFGTALGNTMGAIICTFLLRRIMRFDNALERTRDVAGYIGLACFLGTSVNAAFNVVSLAYAGTVSWSDLFPTILEWWVPNALAGLVVAPFLITWATPSALRWYPRLVVEAAVCATGLVAGTLISFHS